MMNHAENIFLNLSIRPTQNVLDSYEINHGNQKVLGVLA